MSSFSFSGRYQVQQGMARNLVVTLKSGTYAPWLLLAISTPQYQYACKRVMMLLRSCLDQNDGQKVNACMYEYLPTAPYSTSSASQSKNKKVVGRMDLTKRTQKRPIHTVHSHLQHVALNDTCGMCVDRVWVSAEPWH